MCDSRINHVAFEEILRPFIVLEQKVKVKALERLKFEGLNSDKAIISPDGRYYGDPTGFALHHFAFYQCFICKGPYYAGARACGAADVIADVNRADLICVGCQSVNSQNTCAIHGDDWLSFKCRFCCNISVWHCWSKTHFCEYCHSHYSEFVESCSGINTRPYNKYSNCPSLQAQLDSIESNSFYATDKEKQSAMEHCLSDPSDCPLGIRHPPHGIEFGIGCGMCRNEESKDSDVAYAEKIKTLECLSFDNLSISHPQFLILSTNNKVTIKIENSEIEKPDLNGWVTKTDPLSGKKYYYHNVVRNSTWIDPNRNESVISSPSNSKHKHPLAPTINPYPCGSFICDLCKSKHLISSISWHCKECSYDECSKCHPEHPVLVTCMLIGLYHSYYLANLDRIVAVGARVGKFIDQIYFRFQNKPVDYYGGNGGILAPEIILDGTILD